jgi:hypothetical protein
MAAKDGSKRAYEPPRLFDIGGADERAQGATGCGGGSSDTTGTCTGGGKNQGSGCAGGGNNETGSCQGGGHPGRAVRRRR